jgi:hypothetical protein
VDGLQERRDRTGPVAQPDAAVTDLLIEPAVSRMQRLQLGERCECRLLAAQAALADRDRIEDVAMTGGTQGQLLRGRQCRIEGALLDQPPDALQLRLECTQNL